MPVDVVDRVFTEAQRLNKPLIIRSVPLLKGVINRFAAQYIPEDSVSVLQNGDLTDPTRPAIRDGYSEIGAAQTGIDAALKILRISGFAYLNTTAGTRLLVITIPNSGSGKTYRLDDVDGGTWTVSQTGGSADFDPGNSDTVMFQANDGLYFLGAANVFTMDSSGVMYDALDVSGTLKSPPQGGVDGAYFLNRAWILKAGTSALPPELHYSILLPDPANPDVAWDRLQDGATTVAGRFQLSPNWGAAAVACRPWNQTSMIVFFDTNIEEVIIDSADPGDSSTRRVLEPRFGTRSRDSIVTIGQEMFFLDQFGEFRSLQQTVNAAQAGVVPKPISEPIKDELPGSLNMNALDKVRAIAYRDKIYLWYPRLGESEAKSMAVFDTSLRIWIGAPWRMADEASRVLVSNMRESASKGEELYFSDGAAAVARVYRQFDGSFKDNGATITYSEETKAFDFDIPEANKTPTELELEGKGAQGAVATAAVRIEEGGGWQQLSGQLAIPGNEASDFPLGSASFPLTAASFPLVDADPPLTRAKFHLNELNFGEGRTIQLRVQAKEPGKLFQRTGFRLMARPEAYQEEE